MQILPTFKGVTLTSLVAASICLISGSTNAETVKLGKLPTYDYFGIDPPSELASVANDWLGANYSQTGWSIPGSNDVDGLQWIGRKFTRVIKTEVSRVITQKLGFGSAATNGRFELQTGSKLYTAVIECSYTNDDHTKADCKMKNWSSDNAEGSADVPFVERPNTPIESVEVQTL